MVLKCSLEGMKTIAIKYARKEAEGGNARGWPRVPEGANMPVGVEGRGEGMLEGARPMSFGKGGEEKGAE